MNLTKYSIYTLAKSADRWSVDAEYFEPMYNYLVHGFIPGSFFSAILANDAMGAISHSHPLNSVQALKNLASWIQDSFPADSFGSYPKVHAWLDLTEADRRQKLEQANLIFSEQQEIIVALKGDLPTPDMNNVLYTYNKHIAMC